MKRGEIRWANLPKPLGKRPVVIVTRDAAIPVRLRITVAPITTTIRSIPVEVPVGKAEGLERDSVVNVDDLVTVPKSWISTRRTGRLSAPKLRLLRAAIRYALEVE